MKIGLIGLGAMGQNHARVLSALGVLGPVFDTDSNKLVQTSNQYNATPAADEDDFISLRPDGVIIATPTKSHLVWAKQCLYWGLPVLVEKPISDNVQDAKEIVELAQDYSKLLAVGYIERFNPAFKFLLELIDQNYFGEITSINIKRVGGDPRTADNVILDLMTHDLDLLMRIFKAEPTSIATHIHSHNDVVDSAQALLGFGSASATCEANWLSPVKMREIHITGTKGCVVVDLIRQELTKLIGLSKNSKVCEVHNLPGEPLVAELQAFMADITAGKCINSVSGEDAVRALRTTLKVAGK